MLFTPDESTHLLEIARSSIRATLQNQPPPNLETTNPALTQPAGCFVSLHEKSNHRLRGCIGRIDANGPLAQVVQQTAISVLSDPRFTNNRVTLETLPLLEIDLSVLSPLTAAANPLDFDLQNDGIYLTISNRTGCFLPQVARETGWSKEQLLDRLCAEKMNFPPKMWQHPAARLQKFNAAIVGPESF